MNESVSSLLREKGSTVFSITPNASVLEAVNEMNHRHIGSILVIENEKLVGIFTERDVLQRVVAAGRYPASTLVGDVMSRKVETLTSESTIAEAMDIMTDHRHRHLPVLENDKICGLISIGDLTRWISQSNAQEASTLRDYITGCYS